MGSFEKLGILVIVVIIVMILAVAIYQWGGTERPDEFRTVHAGDTPTMIVGTGGSVAKSGVRKVDYLDKKDEEQSEKRAADPAPTKDSWPGGIPKSYVIRSGDVVWNLVVKTWQLREGFSDAISRANPDVNMKRLRPGQRLRIPNPDAYRSGTRTRKASGSRGTQTARKAPRGARWIEVQEGDMIGSIAYEQLGKASRASEIMELNPGVKPKSLKPGDRLLIPAR